VVYEPEVRLNACPNDQANFRFAARAHPPTLTNIQALRGLAALSVVGFHAFQWVDDRGWIGAAGVDVFFVISGFIIWTVGSGPESRPGVFFWRRLTRVAPAYWAVTAVVGGIAAIWPLFLPQVSLSTRHVLLSLAFIQHHDPNGLAFPVLPPGWTLNYEAVFYVLFTLTLFAPARFRFALLVAALAGEVALGFADPPLYGLGANPMMLQFAAGAWLARRQLRGRRIEPRAGMILAASGLALLVVQGLTGFRNELFRPLLWGVPALMIVTGAVAAERAFAAPRWLTRLGDASYAIYLCHLPAVALTAHLLGARPLWLFVPEALAVSTGAGLAFHRWVETPLIAACRALPARLFPAANSDVNVLGHTPK
jgi:exopolysaccharide production protein ExoZ